MITTYNTRPGRFGSVERVILSIREIGVNRAKDGTRSWVISPQNRQTNQGAYQSSVDLHLSIDKTSWIALRCFEDRPDGRPRFAHTSPFHLEVADRPLRPTKAERAYLVGRVADELKRHQGTLSKDALAEFENALQAYEKIEVRAAD